jgi:biofilm PGA synthesis N-glycosyltransferase PgaC
LPQQILFVDDSSTDDTPAVLARYVGRIEVVRTPHNTGNKSHAQKYGLQFVTGDIVVTTDADTILDTHLVEEFRKSFEDPNVVAMCGKVTSLKYNWLTRIRAFEYGMSNHIHKLAQSYIDYMFVIPGAAGAFNTAIFREKISFDHDTITEDLDFTYKLHKQGLSIGYNRLAVVYTQDPAKLSSYINQMRRWYAGGWQNLLKHWDVIERPIRAFELSLIYVEGFIFSILLFLIPFINILFALYLGACYVLMAFIFACFVAARERRPDILLSPPLYLCISYINAYIFLEQFIKEVILRQKNMLWFKPERTQLL